MNVCALALLVSIIGSRDAMWEGIGAAWLLAMFADTSVYILLTYFLFCK